MMLARTAQRVEEMADFHAEVHRPVMAREVRDLLVPRAGDVLVDATLGAGGHAESLLEEVGPQGRVYGIDRDLESLRSATRRLAHFGECFVPVHGNHADIRQILAGLGVDAVDGVVADLGVSSVQLDSAERGFSFLRDGPLDMRMDRSRGPSAADLLAALSETELTRVLRSHGEERKAASLARAIVRERAVRPIRTTLHLAEIVERVLGPAARQYRIHPATRTFQALRIAVNGEIQSIHGLIEGAVSSLRSGRRLAVISFHSLEARAVKEEFRALAVRCVCPPGLPVCGCGRANLVRIVTPHALAPSPEEVQRNPRARSAQLRAVERL